MKIAITSDLHLTTREKHPERFQVLEWILSQMAKESIQTLILAGDVFDADTRNYSEFDSICQKAKSAGIRFLIIPGNHDPGFKQSSLTSDNVSVFEEPELYPSDLISMPILFVPYIRDKNLGDAIADFSKDLSDNKWILIGHGEWTEGLRERNPLEPGVYMPLSRADLDRYRPAQVVLGHIHKPLDRDPVWVPGSPCPLDINETGRRRFLILDAEKGAMETRPIQTGPIFFQSDLVVLPVVHETDFIREEIQSDLKKWSLSSEEMERVRIRVTVKGYSENKKALSDFIKEVFQRFRFYQDEGPDLDSVSDAEESDRTDIARRAGLAIEALRFQSRPDDPDENEILLEALKVIYESK